MARYLVVTTVNVNDAGGSPMQLRKGMVVDASAAQITAWGASNFRAETPPANAQVINYIGGATVTFAVSPASQTHDTSGENAGVSN